MEKKGDNRPFFLNFHGAPPTPEAFGFFLYEVIIEGGCSLFSGRCNPWRGLLFHSEERGFLIQDLPNIQLGFGGSLFYLYLSHPFFSQLT